MTVVIVTNKWTNRKMTYPKLFESKDDAKKFLDTQNIYSQNNNTLEAIDLS